MSDVVQRLLAMRAASADPGTLQDAIAEIERLRAEVKRWRPGVLLPCQQDGLAGRGA